MFPHCKLNENDIRDYLENLPPEPVLQSIGKESLSFTDFINMLSPAAAPHIEKMRKRSAEIKNARFGKTVRLYSPLYISNYCINNCVYCGFRQSSNQKRKRLSLDEILAEAEVIRGYGIESLLLVSGEDPKAVSVDFFEKATIELKKMFSYISIEIYPMDEKSYRRLFEAGVHGLTLYQETYNRNLYAELHPSGPKSDYDARLKAVENGAKAGFYNIGLGALLGLYDWRIEAVSMAAHAMWLKKNYWKSRIQFSFPRITPAAKGFNVPTPVTENELEQVMLAFRIFFPDSDIYISTREGAEFRKHISAICASHMSAASKVVPGGYSSSEDEKLGQFTVNDRNSVGNIEKEIEKLGLEAVFRDWHQCMGVK